MTLIDCKNTIRGDFMTVTPNAWSFLAKTGVSMEGLWEVHKVIMVGCHLPRQSLSECKFNATSELSVSLD